MHRTNVTSSTIKTAGYESSGLLFEIEFKNGCIYQYFNVPTGTADNFMASDSKGRFFHKEIKNAYTCKKIYDPKDEVKETVQTGK